MLARAIPVQWDLGHHTQEIRPSGVLAVIESAKVQWLRNHQPLAKTGRFQMPRTRRWIALGFLLVTPALLAQTSAPAAAPTPAPAAAPTPAPAAKPTSTPTTAPTATPAPLHKPHKTKTPPPKPLVLPPLQSGPLSQVPMDQIPATPAKVSYEGGLLAISAHNSTLSEILRDVRKLTGASIEIPQGASERVVADLGPGAPRDVLALLLNGTSFNYVMLGSNSDPKAVSSVILMLKPSAAELAASSNQGATANRVPPVQPLNRPLAGRGPVSAQTANAQDDDKDDEDNADDSADNQAQPQPVQPVQPSAQDQQGQQAEQGQPNAGPKTPEQILEELRKQQQQSGGALVNPNPQQQTPPQPPPQE